MSGKTVAGIVLILAVVNLFALMWYQIVFLEVAWAIWFFVVVTVLVITFSASAFSEKKK